MWRALALAIGISLCIVGAESLAVEKMVLAQPKPAAEAPTNNPLRPPAVEGSQEKREFKPPEWFPWTLLSTGAVVILYSFTLPSRVKG